MPRLVPILVPGRNCILPVPAYRHWTRALLDAGVLRREAEGLAWAPSVHRFHWQA